MRLILLLFLIPLSFVNCVSSHKTSHSFIECVSKNEAEQVHRKVLRKPKAFEIREAVSTQTFIKLRTECTGLFLIRFLTSGSKTFIIMPALKFNDQLYFHTNDNKSDSTTIDNFKSQYKYMFTKGQLDSIEKDFLLI